MLANHLRASHFHFGVDVKTLLQVGVVEARLVFDYLLHKSQGVAESAVTRPEATLRTTLRKLIRSTLAEKAVFVTDCIHDPAGRFLSNFFATSTASFWLNRLLRACLYEGAFYRKHILSYRLNSDVPASVLGMSENLNQIRRV